MKRPFFLTLFVLQIQIVSAKHQEYSITTIAKVTYIKTSCSEGYSALLKNGDTITTECYSSGPWEGQCLTFLGTITQLRSQQASVDTEYFNALKSMYDNVQNNKKESK